MGSVSRRNGHYVVVLKPEGGETRIPIKGIDNCDHMHSMCPTVSCISNWSKDWFIRFGKTKAGRKLMHQALYPCRRFWSEALGGLFTYDGYVPSWCQCKSHGRCKCKPGTLGYKEREEARNR